MTAYEIADRLREIRETHEGIYGDITKIARNVEACDGAEVSDL